MEKRGSGDTTMIGIWTPLEAYVNRFLSRGIARVG
jgi:hypothetical protein